MFLSNLSLPLCTCPKTLLVVQMCTHCDIVAKSTDASFGDDTDISAVAVSQAKQRYKPRVLTAVTILIGLGASSCKWHSTMPCYVSICPMFSLTLANLVHMVLSHRYRQQGEGQGLSFSPSQRKESQCASRQTLKSHFRNNTLSCLLALIKLEESNKGRLNVRPSATVVPLFTPHSFNKVVSIQQNSWRKQDNPNTGANNIP